MTRLPLAAPARADGVALSRALRFGPLAGLLIGVLGAGVYGLADWCGLGAPLAALLAVAAGIALTGALHEDGLADFADGLGVAAGPQARLAAMRDSRVGVFGVLALVLSVTLRAAALASLAAPGLVLAALLAAHAGARAPVPLVMLLAPRASGEGLAAGLSRPSTGNALLAAGLGLLALLVCLGPAAGLLAFAVVLGLAWATARLARRRLGGISGDVIGAQEQLAEAAILLVAVAWS